MVSSPSPSGRLAALIGKREDVPLECPDDAEGVPGEVAFVDFPGLLTQGKVIQQGDALRSRSCRVSVMSVIVL